MSCHTKESTKHETVSPCQAEGLLGEERAKGLESARKLKVAEAELETASKVSSKQWSLIQAAGAQLKAEIAKNKNLRAENDALKKVSDKYQEMYSEYMEMRAERVKLEKQVRDMATSRAIYSRKAAAAGAIARRLRDNVNMDVGL